MFDDLRAIQLVLDAIPIAIYAKDSASRFVLMNTTCELQWGMTFTELCGTTGSQLFPAKRMEVLLAMDRKIFEGGHPFEFEENYWNASLKEDRYGHTFKKPIFDRDGNPLFLICATVDITDRRIASDNLITSEEKLRRLFDMSPLGIARNAMDGTFLEANASLLNMVGYSLAELNSLKYWDLTPEYYADQEVLQLECLKTTHRYGPYEKEYINKRGELIPVRLNGALIAGSDGEQYIWSIIENISGMKQLVDQLRISAVAFESQEPMVISDANNVVLQVNSAFTEMTGYTAEEAIRQKPHLIKSGRHSSEFYTTMWMTINSTGGWCGEIWDRRKNGEEYPKWLTITVVKNDQGVVTHYISVHRDITLRKQSEDRISELAFFDQLTGLPNRTLLRDRLRQTMTASSRNGIFGAVLFIDLDNFKIINDTLGHDMGDEVLKQAANRLSRCIRVGDTVARLGGDEFVVMLPSLSTEEMDAAAKIRIVGDKILSALTQPYQLIRETCRSSGSIGATSIRGESVTIDELMKQADLAMYQAKKGGRNALRFFDPGMESAIKKLAAAEVELRSAVEGKQFILHYQPQVTDDGRVIGVEALVRWQHSTRGLIYPDQFISLSEETGLILPLGSWVLDAACLQLAAWATSPKFSHLTIAVNVSAHQIHLPDFVEKVLSALSRSGANPARLKIELTESVLITDVEQTIIKMNALKAKGVSFSLDDFGTGYSSLTYLKRLPMDQLKIDRVFVKDILVDPVDAAIAKMIITLGENLGMNVIAEGVEIETQKDFLLSLGCHCYQGYHFSRPLPIQDFEEFLNAWRFQLAV